MDEAGEEWEEEEVEAPVDPVEPNDAGGPEVIPDEEPPDEDPALPIGDDMFTGRVVDDCKSNMKICKNQAFQAKIL